MFATMKLSVNNLSLRTSTQTLVNNVSFTLEDNQTIAIIGPSGCGKTSLLKGILGLSDDHIKEGRVDFHSSLRFGYVPQDLSLWPHLTVAETLRLTHHFAKLSCAFSPQIFADCDLADLQHKKPSALSGGEKQRLALARALINDPHVLVLDEPFAHLDLVAKTKLIALIMALKERISIVFVSHDIAETLTVGDRVMIMDKGAVIWLGERSDIGKASFMPHWNPLTSPLLNLCTFTS
jgi:ABC-type multidrug transport system ATPase subunit